MIKIWDVKEVKVRFELKDQIDSVIQVILSKDEKSLISIDSDIIRIRAIKTGDYIQKIKLDTGIVLSSVALSDDGNTLVVGDELGFVKVFRKEEPLLASS